MKPLGEAQARAAATYNAAADAYDDADNTFWDRFGRRTTAPSTAWLSESPPVC